MKQVQQVARRIVVIQTAPTATKLIQVTDLMSEEELAQAKLERPDLIFRYAADLQPVTEKEILQSKEVIKPEDYKKGLSHSGMTLPVDFYERLDKAMKD